MQESLDRWATFCIILGVGAWQVFHLLSQIWPGTGPAGPYDLFAQAFLCNCNKRNWACCTVPMTRHAQRAILWWQLHKHEAAKVHVTKKSQLRLTGWGAPCCRGSPFGLYRSVPEIASSDVNPKLEQPRIYNMIARKSWPSMCQPHCKISLCAQYNTDNWTSLI